MLVCKPALLLPNNKAAPYYRSGFIYTCGSCNKGAVSVKALTNSLYFNSLFQNKTVPAISRPSSFSQTVVPAMLSC